MILMGYFKKFKVLGQQSCTCGLSDDKKLLSIFKKLSHFFQYHAALITLSKYSLRF